MVIRIFVKTNQQIFYGKNYFATTIDLILRWYRVSEVKEINLQQAYDLLQQSAAVVLDGRLLEPILLGVEKDESNEFMYIDWEEEYEDETLTVDISFIEGDNQIVLVDGSKMILVNSEGTEEELTLLREFDAESLIISKS